jgi:hypothetical protein
MQFPAFPLSLPRPKVIDMDIPERNGQRERINKSEALARRSAVPGINPTVEPSQHFEEDPAFRNHVIGSPRRRVFSLPSQAPRQWRVPSRHSSFPACRR